LREPSGAPSPLFISVYGSVDVLPDEGMPCSVRIWMRPRVRVGARYRMEEGEVEVDSIEPIGFPDITPELARESGFLGVLDLLKVARHGRGENIYLIRFHYVRPRAKRMGQRKSG